MAPGLEELALSNNTETQRSAWVTVCHLHVLFNILCNKLASESQGQVTKCKMYVSNSTCRMTEFKYYYYYYLLSGMRLKLKCLTVEPWMRWSKLSLSAKTSSRSRADELLLTRPGFVLFNMNLGAQKCIRI